jgi:uncharacterized protein (TIGR02246 family)
LRKLIRAACTLAPLLIAQVPEAARAADQSIGDFEAAQQAAWNAHDAAAYTAAFGQDATIVTAQGWRWTGQADAARNLGDGFKLVYAHAQLRLSDPQIRTLTPDLASVTLAWTIDGARTIEGGASAGEQHGFQTQLLQRRGESWLILSQQDTMTAAAPPPTAASAASSAPASSTSTTATPAPPSAFPTTPPPVRRCIVADKNGHCLVYGKAKPAPTN